MTEQLAFDHAVSEGLAVDRDEGAVGARAPVVEHPRDQLLAGAALALDERGRTRRRDPAHHRDQLLALRALGDKTGRGARGTSSPRYFAFHNPSTRKEVTCKEVTSEIPSRRQTSGVCAPASSLLQNPVYLHSTFNQILSAFGSFGLGGAE